MRCHYPKAGIWSVPSVALCGLMALGATGCEEVDCAEQCRRVRQCEPQVSEALIARQPARSQFMMHVRKQMPERTVKPLIKSCPERCEMVRKSSTWRKRLQRCAKLKQCAAFARCIAPTLEP